MPLVSPNSGMRSGGLMRSGVYAQNAARQIVTMARPDIMIDAANKMVTRRLDWILRIGDRVAQLEVKYSLPRGGESLQRLVGQMTEAVASGRGQTVVWSLKEPTAAEIQTVISALGNVASRVQFVSGVDGLYRWVLFYFGAG